MMCTVLLDHNKSALSHYHDKGHIHWEENEKDLAGKLIRDWQSAGSPLSEKIILAHRNKDGDWSCPLTPIRLSS